MPPDFYRRADELSVGPYRYKVSGRQTITYKFLTNGSSHRFDAYTEVTICTKEAVVFSTYSITFAPKCTLYFEEENFVILCVSGAAKEK